MRLHGVLLLLSVASLSAASIGCAADSDEDAESADAALTEYQGVKRNGTKITSDTTPSATESAKTRLVGYIPDGTIEEVAAQLLKVDRWTTIKSRQGDKPFEAASVKSDSTNAGVRTVNGKVTLQGDIPLEIRAVVRTEDDKITIRIANTTGYKHWLAGKILEPGKMTIDVTLVSLDGGVIVDSTIKVKLEQMEDKAATFCSSLPMVFDWLKAKI